MSEPSTNFSQQHKWVYSGYLREHTLLMEELTLRMSASKPPLNYSQPPSSEDSSNPNYKHNSRVTFIGEGKVLESSSRRIDQPTSQEVSLVLQEKP